MNATRRIVLGLALAVTAGVAVRAQQPPSPPATEPQVTFKVEINYVEVDAAVFDRQGGFVRDLKRDDFEVIEDGVAQDVTAFTQVNIPIERAEPAPLQASAVIEPDVISNARPFEGRVYVIILDDKHTAAMRSIQTKRAAEQFITRYMADNDLAAVITTSGQGGGTQEFTSNKRLLLRAVDKFIGQKLRSETEERLDEYQRQRATPGQEIITGSTIRSDMQRGYDARVALETLARISDWVGSIRGRRKAIVFFSEGIDYNIYDFNKREATTVQEKMREVFASATRSNVSIYSVDPRGLTTLGDETIQVSGGFPDNPQLNLSLQSFNDSLRLSQDSLRSLSEETGGFAAVNRNDFSDAFSRVVKDSSSYYVLGYYPKNDRRDGRFRKIEVKVKRPGAEVRSRRGYTAPRGKAAVAAEGAGQRQDVAAGARGARQPAAAAVADAERVCRAVQGHRAQHGRGRHHRSGRQRLRLRREGRQAPHRLRGVDDRHRPAGQDQGRRSQRRQLRHQAGEPSAVRADRRARLDAAAVAAGTLPAARRRARERDGPRRFGQLRPRRPGLHAGADRAERRGRSPRPRACGCRPPSRTRS